MLIQGDISTGWCVLGQKEKENKQVGRFIDRQTDGHTVARRADGRDRLTNLKTE